MLASLLLSGCNLAPHYATPSTPAAPVFKEAPGWQVGAPADDIAKGAWWRLFGDPVLDGLETRVAVSNQNVLAASAAYGQARAAVRELRAQLFPTIDLSGSGTRAGSFGNNTTTIISGGTGTTGTGTTGTGTTGTGTSTTVTSGTSGSRRYSLSLGASWEPDLWGRISSGVRQQKALAEATLGDLNNATLSAQGELASDYVQLRGLDRQKAILDDTIAAYQRAYQITNNRYNAGVVARVDVLQAQTQLSTARANAADITRQRQIFEHAIAVLVGESPSTFSIQPMRWAPVVPLVPGILPATLLQRRPDIAAAERRVAAANQAIGVEKAAFFPTLNLTGSVGSNTSSLGSLFSASSSFWSLGAQIAETILDFGARSARVREARFAYDQAVANYRQTVLTAFQQVEDELAATQVLAYVARQRADAAQVASRVEQITQNQYLSGQIAYTDVITQQATALSARQAEATAVVDQQTAAVTLIQAIGGSWPPPGPPPAR
ncbi:efflux transporter outer membrane subunit [Sphingomonas bacterium]|uniref:efflux transporter outer membrane subunit n=1 Tax=Sphingomonas bacterium TaxID=1895847 RepID=UPI0020C6296C|nr:efflux transporter outer membrane subunit [Sphingomonas bacterium]